MIGLQEIAGSLINGIQADAGRSRQHAIPLRLRPSITEHQFHLRLKNDRMRLHFGRPDPLDYQTLIIETPNKEFEKLTRSTIPLLTYWASPRERIDAICEKIDVTVSDDIQLCFEYPVLSVGRAKASYTDIMGITASMCIAIEGKSREKDYDSAKIWLAKGGSNRQAVLMHWLKLIATKTGIEVTADELTKFDNVTYQMIHRTASACSIQKPRTVVVYQVFDVNGKLPNYKEKLMHLADSIQANGKFDILLCTINTNRTEEYEAAENEIKKLDKKETPQFVRNAVLEGKLFEFEEPKWEVISTTETSATDEK